VSAGQLPSEIQSPGTEFLDAETGGQKSPRETVGRPVKSLEEHLAANRDKAEFSAKRSEDRGDPIQLVANIVVHNDKLVVQLKADNADESADCPDDRSLTIPWQKAPSKRSRQILLPHHMSRNEVRPEQFERRARLVSAIARGRQWLDDVLSGRVTTIAELCTREKCSVRQVNMTISLAFLAPQIQGRDPARRRTAWLGREDSNRKMGN
jgi:site-specific DNA recombinase